MRRATALRLGWILTLSLGATAALVVPAEGGTDSGTVIAEGSLTDAAGNSLQGVVTAYPSIVSGSGLVGDLGSATTDSSGHFAIRATDPAALRKAATGNSGVANLTLMANAGRMSGATFTPVRLTSGSASAASITVAVPATASITAYADPASRAKGHAHCPPPGTVRTRVVKVWHHKPILVGELNNAYRDGTHARWEYGRQADTFAQSGAKIGDKGWKISGGVSIHNTSSAAVSKRLGRKGSLKLRSNFVVKKGTGLYCDSQHHRHRSWGIAADRWVGGLSQRHNHGLHRCPRHDAYGSHTSFSRTTKNAVLWHRGFEAGPLTFGSRSGYSEWVKVHERFGHLGKHFICGKHGHSAVSSGRIFSGAR